MSFLTVFSFAVFDALISCNAFFVYSGADFEVLMRENNTSLLSDVYLYHQNPTEYFYVSYVSENADYLRNKPIEPSFTEIQQWIVDNYGFKVGNMYVSEVKRDHGIQALGNFTYPRPDATKHFKCPPEKRAAIEAALRHFHMI